MKKILLLSLVLMFLNVAQVSAQNCINFTLNQDDIGIPDPTFGVSLADFDGDGWLDVVVINAYDDISIYFNDGTGHIDTNGISLGEDRWRYGVKAFDIDNDGDMDFVTSPFTSDSYGLEVWKNLGLGYFILKSENAANYSSGHEFAVGDLNGDGYQDIFFPNSDKVGIYLNDGTGNFVDNGQDLQCSSPEGAVLFDADNDGDLDAAVARGFPGKFYINDGTGHFTEAQNEMADDTEGVDAADINGDGYLDLVYAPWHGYIEIWYNDGLGTFLPGDTVFDGGQQFFNDIELRDINYDNLPDIITDYYIFQNDPSNPGHFTVSGSSLSGSSHDFETGDINNDNFLDIYKGRFSSSSGDMVYFFEPGTIINVDTTICFGDSLLVGGIWRTEAGEYYGSAGCDSTEIVNLSFYDEINTNVNQEGETLTAEAEGDDISYQWINCADGSYIDGATGQSFTPEETGDYAVIITQGNCSAVSDCYTVVITGVNKNHFNDISVYPNPTKGTFTVDVKRYNGRMDLTVTDVMGNKLYEMKNVNGNKVIDLSNQSSGVYFIMLKTGNTSIIKKIIKQ